MIGILVMAGFSVGASAAVIALAGGFGLVAALLAYAVFAVTTVVVVAIGLAMGRLTAPPAEPAGAR